MNKKKHVLLVLGWYDYRLHKGIAEYAEKHGWHLSANLARERVIPWGWEGDGVLAWLGAGDDLVEFVESLACPVVDFSLRRPHLPFARVLQDHAHAARLVVSHFLTRGFQNYAYFSDADNWSFEERGRGFQAALQAHGFACTWIKWHESPAFRRGREEWTRRREWLVTQLRQAPKPLALFVANDHLALDVLESCSAAALRVPEDVAIVGAGNYLMAIDAMQTPISSVDTNFAEQGYEGACLLDRLMHGQPVPPEPVRIPSLRVIIRKSSDILAVNEPRMGRALRFIAEHFQESIGVDDVARASAMSRRALHQAFVDHLGRTPGEQVRRVRMEHAKKLLGDSDDKLPAIAEACGYRSANHFSVAFTKAEGISPSAYRRFIHHG